MNVQANGISSLNDPTSAWSCRHAPTSPNVSARWRARMIAILAVLASAAAQAAPVTTLQVQNLENQSKSNTHLTFGRFEGALEVFNTAVDAHLGPA